VTARIRGVVGALASCCLLLPGASRAAGGRVAAGVDVARLVPPAGAVVEPYENAGYALRFVSGAVEIAVDLAPLESRTPFAPPPGQPAGRLERIAREASAGATTRFGAVAGVLGWVSRNIRYELARDRSQEPGDVLARGSGYCTGLARLSVALLDALGIEAREVPGYRYQGKGAEAQHGFHRWIEVHYPDRGWVFSDPVASHQFVPATYLRLAAERLEVEPGTGALLERRDGVRDVDLAPWLPAQVRVRPNGSERGSAALVVRMPDGQDGEAWLAGNGVSRSARFEQGELRFLGLAPGRYELEVTAQGRLAARKRLLFRAPVLGEVTITAGSEPAAGGGMR
jgi:hypothetical protein